jgi:hypothetical protein
MLGKQAYEASLACEETIVQQTPNGELIINHVSLHDVFFCCPLCRVVAGGRNQCNALELRIREKSQDGEPVLARQATIKGTRTHQ